MEDPSQLHIEVLCWVLDQLQKNSLFAFLKKCRFYQNEINFLRYIMSSKDIKIEIKKIKEVKEWPEPKSI